MICFVLQSYNNNAMGILLYLSKLEILRLLEHYLDKNKYLKAFQYARNVMPYGHARPT